MNDNELKRKELENADILELLHEMRDKENNSFATRECRPYAKRKRRLVSPYWLVAASMIGFVIGIAVPKGMPDVHDDALAQEKNGNCAVSIDGNSLGKSIASGDVNLKLLRSR